MSSKLQGDVAHGFRVIDTERRGRHHYLTLQCPTVPTHRFSRERHTFEKHGLRRGCPLCRDMLRKRRGVASKRSPSEIKRRPEVCGCRWFNGMRRSVCGYCQQMERGAA